MFPSTRWTCASPCSWVSLPLLTSLAAWFSVTSRAFSRPVSTKRWSTSLSTTGMSAAAMTCAISPPMTPAPTTAALKTNMAGTLAAGHGLQLHIPAPLAGEAGERSTQRGDHRPAYEQDVHERAQRTAVLELVVERERDLRLVRARGELDPLGAAQAAVLDHQRLPGAGLERGHDLEHTAAAVRHAVPQQPSSGGPLLGQLDHVAEPVDP